MVFFLRSLWLLLSRMPVRVIAVLGLFGCLLLTFVAAGCASSIGTASLRYREEHQNDDHLLPDITVERLQECVEKHGSQLEPESVDATVRVQVDQEGRVKDVVVTGIPDSAPDLAACTRVTLREMTAPASVLQLRRKQTVDPTNGQTAPQGNEMANPLVLVDIAVLLGKFVAEHGGRVVLYSVTVSVLTTAAVVATQEMAKKRRRTHKDMCADKYTECMESPVGWERGNNWNTSRCETCRSVCQQNKKWPSHVPMHPEGDVSCN